MICVSIADKDLDGILKVLELPQVQMAEIRLDRCSLTTEEIEDLFASVDKPLIATYSLGKDQSRAAEAESKLLTAIGAGAAFIDLDVDAPAMMCKRLRREAREAGTFLIRSFHDYEGTDSARALAAVAEKCQHLGADIVKICTTANCKADNEKVLSLYGPVPPGNLVAFCMGDAGRESRIDCLRKGAPFSYAAVSAEEATAPGQMTLEEMAEAVYGSSPLNPMRSPIGSSLIESVCSKSYAQRAIILAALADGVSTLEGYTSCGDNEAALEAAKAIGAKVSVEGKTVKIEGTGGKVKNPATVHAGESGFLTRMLLPALAAAGKTPVTITGEKTLLQRPLPGAKEMLGCFGVQIDKESVPITAQGTLLPGNHTIDGSNGSQLVSGLLAALPLCRSGNSQIRLENPKSIPYIFLTLDIMRQFGVNVGCEMEGGEEFAQSQEDWSLCEAMTFQVPGGCNYRSAKIKIEADWSAAANFLAAGAIFGKADLSGLDTKSLQADLSILDILPTAGAAVSQEEESGIIHVVRGPLRAFDLDASNCPDLVPIISVLAAFCQGRSNITGVARLATKESNRPGVIVEMLTKMGVRASLRGDKLSIEGHSLESRLLGGHLLNGGNYSAYGDHRIAMALEVAAIGAKEPIIIDDRECVSKSFPDFDSTLRKYKSL